MDNEELLEEIEELKEQIEILEDENTNLENNNDDLKYDNEKLESKNEKLVQENAELKSRLEKSVKLPCKVGEECYILKLPFMKIEKATALFTCLATRTESGTQIMNMRNVFKTKEEAKQALKGGNENA